MKDSGDSVQSCCDSASRTLNYLPSERADQRLNSSPANVRFGWAGKNRFQRSPLGFVHGERSFVFLAPKRHSDDSTLRYHSNGVQATLL